MQSRLEFISFASGFAFITDQFELGLENEWMGRSSYNARQRASFHFH